MSAFTYPGRVVMVCSQTFGKVCPLTPHIWRYVIAMSRHTHQQFIPVSSAGQTGTWNRKYLAVDSEEPKSQLNISIIHACEMLPSLRQFSTFKWAEYQILRVQWCSVVDTVEIWLFWCTPSQKCREVLWGGSCELTMLLDTQSYLKCN